jgi:DNA-binding GntR family transcriptional regulator
MASPVLSTVESIVADLTHAIASGELRGGERLVEADLTRRFDVSRGSVREAMRRLTAEGLVEVHFHRGARVAHLSRAEVYGLFDLREMLEALAARLAAARLSVDGNEASMNSLEAQMREAAEAHQAEAYSLLNSRFHDLIVAMSGNAHLPAMLGQLRTKAMRFQARQLISSETIMQSFREHAAISAAIRSGDADTAEAAMRGHIRRAKQIVATLPNEMFSSDIETEEPNPFAPDTPATNHT